MVHLLWGCSWTGFISVQLLVRAHLSGLRQCSVLDAWALAHMVCYILVRAP
jgi:hypothetical protein